MNEKTAENALVFSSQEPYIFVSYSHSDPKVLEIIQEMIASRYRVWYDERIKSGNSWGGDISLAIKKCTQFLVFVSNNSVLSENVIDEIYMAKNHKRNIQIVYLYDCDSSVLTGELELWLGRIHTAVYQKRCPSYNAFLMEILKILHEDTRESTSGKARKMLEEKYRITGILGRGSMGQILRGENRSLSVPVLIKQFQLADSITGNVIRQGLREEIRTYCALSSCPYVPSIFDVFEDEGETYIVESFIEGRTADVVLRQMNFASIQAREDWCVDVIVRTAHVLKYFHLGKKVLIHRDIKPKNLMLNSYGDVYVVDLGTCMEWTPEMEKDEVCIGTMGYAAPEQFGGMGASDPRTDIYALGMTLFHLLTGKSPQELSRDNENFVMIRAYNESLHPGLEEIILKATAHDRRERYQDVDELIEALRNFREVGSAELIAMTMRSERRIQGMKPKLPEHVPVPKPVLPQMVASKPMAPKAVNSFAIPARPPVQASVPYRGTIMDTTILSDMMHSTVLA